MAAEIGPEDRPSPRPGIGFITMAYGPDRFIRQAETLARSLRLHMPGVPLALVTDRADAGELFDIVVPMRPFGRAGTLHKINLYDYSPFEETLFIDSDCVVVRPFHESLDAIRAYDFAPIVTVCLREGESDLWLEDVGAALKGVGGTAFPKFNGGVYFFRKGAEASEVFARANQLLARKVELGIKDFDSAGPGDETLIGLAMAQTPELKLFDDNGLLMRTPLNTQGRVEVEVLKGFSSFVKEGKRVSPAIIHFCGPWIDHPTYAIARAELEAGKPASLAARGLVWVRHVLEKVTGKVRRRLSARGA